MTGRSIEPAASLLIPRLAISTQAQGGIWGLMTCSSLSGIFADYIACFIWHLLEASHLLHAKEASVVCLILQVQLLGCLPSSPHGGGAKAVLGEKGSRTP